MKKQKLFWILLVVLLVGASRVLADDGLGSLVGTNPPVVTLAPDAPQALAQAAVLKQYPNAVIHYAIQERDDGRLEWNVFFTDGTQLGECEVNGETYALREVRTYDMPVDALTADRAVEKLAAEKGAIAVTSLELERDDGRLWYQGEAELNGWRYEFEMTIDGTLVEWERD